MPRISPSENRIDRLEDLMAKLIDQNLALGQRIDATNQRMEANNLALGQRLDATNQRIDATNQRIDATLQEIHASNQRLDATNQRIDATLQEIHAQGMETLRLRQESETLKGYLFEMLEKLPDAVRSQIGFKNPENQR
jgi:chromosome segregation ATPase